MSEVKQRRPNQCQKILQYMRENGSITQLQAQNKFRCMRLASRIDELRKNGIAIKTERVSIKDADGVRDTYAVYSLAEDMVG